MYTSTSQCLESIETTCDGDDLTLVQLSQTTYHTAYDTDCSPPSCDITLARDCITTLEAAIDVTYCSNLFAEPGEEYTYDPAVDDCVRICA